MAIGDRGVPATTFERYLVPEEHVVLAVRLHWAKVIEPVLTALATFVVVGWRRRPATSVQSAIRKWWNRRRTSAMPSGGDRHELRSEDHRADDEDLRVERWRWRR